MPLLHQEVRCRHTRLRFHFQANIPPPPPPLTVTHAHTHTHTRTHLCPGPAMPSYSISDLLPYLVWTTL